jgi:hypothetical protein
MMWFETDVSALPIGPIMKGQDVQEERTALSFFLMTAVYV